MTAFATSLDHPHDNEVTEAHSIKHLYKNHKRKTIKWDTNAQLILIFKCFCNIISFPTSCNGFIYNVDSKKEKKKERFLK
jgi:hypothetical protein